MGEIGKREDKKAAKLQEQQRAFQKELEAKKAKEAITKGAADEVIKSANDPARQAEALTGHQQGVDRLTGLSPERKAFYKGLLEKTLPTNRANVYNNALREHEKGKGHGPTSTDRLVGPQSGSEQPQKANNPAPEANTQVAHEHHEAAAALVAKSPHLPPEKAAHYTKTLSSAFGRMSPNARQAVEKVIQSGGTANFHASPQDLTKAVEKQTGRKEKSTLSGAVVNDRRNHHLHLDGDNGSDQAEGVYLHELAHMIDEDHVHSDTPAWKTAWKREIFSPKAGARVIKYARINEAEGFAEMHRLITTEGVDSARKHWPKCVKYFEDKGLLP